MAARLGPGVAVLVIGPTVTGGTQAIGQRGVVERWVSEGQGFVLDISAARDGWIVVLDRPVNWGGIVGANSSGVFPATSLMPLDGEAEADAITTAEPVGVQPVEA